MQSSIQINKKNTITEFQSDVIRALEYFHDAKLCAMSNLMDTFSGNREREKKYELLQSFRLLTMWHAKSNHDFAFSFSVIALGTGTAPKSAGARA